MQCDSDFALLPWVCFRSAIELNSTSTIRGKSVLDVGCGTGILSLLCHRAGAGKVCAVDGSNQMAKLAREIANENGIDRSQMEVFAGKIEDPATLGSARGKHVGVVSAAEESGYKCDVIVSEWMGYALTYESMLASVIRAR